jgi:hypothetical protein
LFIRYRCSSKALPCKKERRRPATGPVCGQGGALLPESLLQKYIRLKRIKLNGKGAKRDTRLAEGDTLQLIHQRRVF